MSRATNKKFTLTRRLSAADGATTGTITVTVKVNSGSDIAGGNLTIAAGSSLP